MLLANIVGVIGVMMINITYFLLCIQKIHPKNPIYGLANLIGGSLIIVSLLFEWNLSAFLMEFSWVAISLYGLMSSLKSERSKV